MTNRRITKKPEDTLVGKWRKGTQYASADTDRLSHAEAQVLGQQIEQMTEDGIPITPMGLLLRAKDPASPLHKHFEWNNTVAAEEYRKDQARKLIHSLEVVLVEPSGPRRVPSHFSVALVRPADTEGAADAKPNGSKSKPSRKPPQEYLSVQKAREEPLAREQVFAKAVEELMSWTHKYEAFGLEELAPVYEVAARFGK